ncbi:MAG TPA: hypothetical protein VG797_04815 [Phycisphaerales bacterium]|nr:hypothetical protein [Phycisphaerales bacterium]
MRVSSHDIPRFQRTADFKTARPRRVRGGLKLNNKDFPPEFGWAASKWFDMVTTAASSESLKLGHEYARLGQTRSMDLQPGALQGRVQGRVSDAYRVSISCPVIPAAEWETLIAAMAEQAIFSATLLSGELSLEIEELFATKGHALLPDGKQFTTSCTCGHDGPWCRHACCLALLLAERIERDPLTLFTLRGMRSTELVDRLRAGRASRSSATANGPRRPLGGPDWPGLRDHDPAPPLAECLDDFWEAGPELAEVETPIKPPEVTHALLRRLGPSPFEGAKFPLVGLLATCYDAISRSVLEKREPDQDHTV